MIVLLYFLLVGIFIGSFLNVIIDRIPRDEGIMLGRSHCDFCNHVLAWYDLVPFFSFLILRGRCRYCHAFIGWKYPLIEATTGIVFVSTAYSVGLAAFPLLLVMLVIMSCLLVVFFIDMFSGIIPDMVLVVLLLSGLAKGLMTSQPLVFMLLAGLASSAFFLLLFLLTRGRGMGLGDVKYAFVMGILLGMPFLVMGLYIAFLTAAGIALILVIARRKSFAGTIAFGPFLVLGTVANLFWGHYIWTIFQRILGI